MKKLSFLFLLSFLTSFFVYAQNIPAYFEVGMSEENIKASVESVKSALESAGFDIIGEYNPGNSENLAVVCYTRPDLEKIALDFPDRGSLAAALKVGFRKEGNLVKISMINPAYLFYAYFVNGVQKSIFT